MIDSNERRVKGYAQAIEVEERHDERIGRDVKIPVVKKKSRDISRR